MRLGSVSRNSLAVERGRIDVHAGTRLQQVADNEADDQGQRREGQEVEHRLAGNASNLLEIRHAGNTGGDSQEDHRCDDHLDELDERVAERLQAGAEIRPEMADQHADDDSGQYLNIKLAVQRQRGTRLRGIGYCNHFVLHRTTTNQLALPGRIDVLMKAARGVPVCHLRHNALIAID
ncbi:hypothetical protein D3C80_1005890 [compost metagenome]